jgi:hypothetical protein
MLTWGIVYLAVHEKVTIQTGLGVFLVFSMLFDIALASVIFGPFARRK